MRSHWSRRNGTLGKKDLKAFREPCKAFVDFEVTYTRVFFHLWKQLLKIEGMDFVACEFRNSLRNMKYTRAP